MSESDKRFNVVFTGKIREGFDLADVKDNFVRMFKVPENKVTSFFNSPRVVLKAGVDRKTADKYKAVLAKAGAVVIIEARQPEASSLAVTAEKTAGVAASFPDKPAGEIKNTGPLWGRKIKTGAAGPASTATPTPPNGYHNEYGSLDKGIAGDYQLTIGDTISEAWQKVYGNKGTVFLAGLLYLGIMIALGIVTGLITNVLTSVAGEAGSITGGFLAQLAQFVVAAPLGAGFVMMGVSMAIGAPAGVGSLLSYYDRTLPLIITSLLYGVMVALGFLLLIIPGLYLSVAYFMAIPLVVDKGLSPWQALEASRKAITHHWFAVFGLLLLLGLLIFIGAIPLLIGLIWVMPLYLIAVGILYRNIFGVSSIASE